MPQPPPRSPRLAAVEREFAEWRRTRTKPHTPRALKAHVVELLGEHSRRQICRVLGINDEMLKRWQAEIGAQSDPAFVALPSLPEGEEPGTEAAWLTLTRHGADGRAVSIQGRFDERRCRWALKLLGEALS